MARRVTWESFSTQYQNRLITSRRKQGKITKREAQTLRRQLRKTRRLWRKYL